MLRAFWIPLLVFILVLLNAIMNEIRGRISNVKVTIRKFGLAYCDLRTMLWNVSVFLRPLTLNIDSNYTKGIPIIFYITTVLTLLCYFYVYVISVLWFVFVRSPQTGELLGATVVMSLGISSDIGIVKLFCMFIYIKKIRKITAAYLEFDSQLVPGSRFEANLLKYSRIVKKRAIVYCVAIMTNGTLYMIAPAFIPGRHLTEDYLVIYGLEPMFESPNFEIACFMMAAGVSIICYISSTVTGYLIVITGYIEAQMLALSEEVKDVWDDAEEYYENTLKHGPQNIPEDDAMKYRIMNKYVGEILKDIIRRHSTVKTLLSKVEDVFRGAIAVGFALHVMGLISDLLGGLENTFMQVNFTFMQLGADCFIGQRVMDAGLVFEQAVYDCKWENFDKNNMKMVLVMLQVSQKTLILSAGGITEMNYQCLMAAIRATYSAFTTLRSTMN